MFRCWILESEMVAMQINLRPASEHDAPAASKVLRRSIAECCTEDHRNDPKLIAAWVQNKTPDTLRSWIGDESHFSVVAVMGSEVAGFAMSSRSGEVLLCYLIPEVRFTGTGRAMLAAIEHQASSTGIQSLYLNSTLTAHSFYTKNGFETSGPTVRAFGMESIPMTKPLNAGLVPCAI
jgi:GNAT superfamily N-acetyltransferase